MLEGTTHARLANSPPPYFFRPIRAPHNPCHLQCIYEIQIRKTRQKKEKENQQKNPRSLEAFIV